MATLADRDLAPGSAPRSAGPGVSTTDLLLIAMSVIWGVNYSVVKYGTGVVDAMAYNGVRVSLAAVALSLIAWYRGGSSLDRRDVLSLLALGVLGNGLYQLLFGVGIARTRAGTAALVLASAPAFIALLGRALGVERIGRKAAAGIALSLLGIGLVVFGKADADGGASTLTGNLIILFGTLCWSVYTVLLKPFGARVDVVRVSAITMVGGAIPLVAVSLPAMLRTEWAHLPGLAWAAMAYSGLGSLVVAYLFWYRGVHVLGPTRTAMYGNLQPAIALGVAWLALHEVPTQWQGLGAGAIIAGIVMTRA